MMELKVIRDYQIFVEDTEYYAKTAREKLEWTH